MITFVIVSITTLIFIYFIIIRKKQKNINAICEGTFGPWLNSYTNSTGNQRELLAIGLFHSLYKYGLKTKIFSYKDVEDLRRDIKKAGAVTVVNLMLAEALPDLMMQHGVLELTTVHPGEMADMMLSFLQLREKQANASQ